MTETACATEGCARPRRSRGLCSLHYERLRLVGKLDGLPREKAPRVPAGCLCPYCGRVAKNNGLCSTHYRRRRLGLDVDAPLRRRGHGYVDKHGYRCFEIDGKEVREHRLVWERHNGRKLRAHETIHHINGDMLDNRIENLELWSSHQPKGQRVADKLAWAKEMILLYEPDWSPSGK